jgi:hypothetical protein
MRVLKMALVVSAVVGAAACQEQPNPPAPDLAWLDSLAQAPAVVDTAQAVASPEELNLTAAAPAPAPVRHTASRSSSHASRSHSVSPIGTPTSAGSYPGPVARSEPRVTVVKHTKRDAAIGAAAGAVIGAVAAGSGDRVKGGVIGAAVGGILGGVIGNNVDKTHRVENR